MPCCWRLRLCTLFQCVVEAGYAEVSSHKYITYSRPFPGSSLKMGFYAFLPCFLLSYFSHISRRTAKQYKNLPFCFLGFSCLVIIKCREMNMNYLRRMDLYLWSVLYIEKIIRKGKILGKSENLRIHKAIYISTQRTCSNHFIGGPCFVNEKT